MQHAHCTSRTIPLLLQAGPEIRGNSVTAIAYKILVQTEELYALIEEVDRVQGLSPCHSYYKLLMRNVKVGTLK